MVDKKVVIGTTSDSAVRPGDVTRISPAVDVSEDSVETSNIARIKTGEEDKGKKTIKLKPVTSTAEGDTGENANVQEDETVKIQKPRPVATPTVPGVKQTIKLRPSSNTPAPENAEDTVSFTSPSFSQAPAPAPVEAAAPTEGAPAAKRTIRLVPKKADATASGNDTATAALTKPSSPTVKLEEPQQAGSPAARSAATVKLQADGGAQEQAAASAPKRTLKLRPVRSGEQAPAPAPAPSPAGATDSEMVAYGATESAPPVASMPMESAARATDGVSGDEPSVLHTIFACAALLAMIFFTWAIVGQYCNNHMDTKITVPGLSDKVK